MRAELSRKLQNHITMADRDTPTQTPPLRGSRDFLGRNLDDHNFQLVSTVFSAKAALVNGYVTLPPDLPQPVKLLFPA
jgi:hypothetical protein